MVAFLYYDHKTEKESHNGSFLLLIRVEVTQNLGEYKFVSAERAKYAFEALVTARYGDGTSRP